MKTLLDCKAVAAILGVKPCWVLAHANGANKPLLPSVKLGKFRRFKREHVEEFIRKYEEKEK
jgi:hypothetical protein